MKNFLYTFLLISWPVLCWAQEDYMNDIAQKTCECLENLPSDQDGNQNMKIGFCVIEAASDYREQLLADHQIDLDRIDEQGKELGVLIGTRAATRCPNTLMALAGGEPEEEVESGDLTEVGRIVDISRENFVKFSLKNAEGKTASFYWLTFVSTEVDLQSQYRDLKGKQVKIGYQRQELFDPQLQEYRSFNVLNSLEFVE